MKTISDKESNVLKSIKYMKNLIRNTYISKMVAGH